MLSGARVKRARWAKGLTAGALAERAKIASATLSAIEAGRSAGSPATAVALAEVLDVPVEELLDTVEGGRFVVRTATGARTFDTADELRAWIDEHAADEPFLATAQAPA